MDIGEVPLGAVLGEVACAVEVICSIERVYLVNRGYAVEERAACKPVIAHIGAQERINLKVQLAGA